MRAVDTNVLVRLLARDDPQQVAVAEDFVEPGAWVSHLVLMEASWVLTAVYKVRPTGLADAIAMLLDHDRLAVQDAPTVVEALARFRQRPSLGFSDCLILEVARKVGHLPLGTFDQDLAHVEGTQGLR